MYQRLVSTRSPLLIAERASIPHDLSRQVKPLYTQDVNHHAQNQHDIAQNKEGHQPELDFWNEIQFLSP